jgi:hypothetical protein
MTTLCLAHASIWSKNLTFSTQISKPNTFLHEQDHRETNIFKKAASHFKTQIARSCKLKAGFIVNTNARTMYDCHHINETM